jgi:flagellar protein FlaI
MMLQTLDAIMVQTQTRVDGKTVRRVQEVTEIVGVDEQTDDVLTNRVYSWKADDDTFRFHGRSNILERVRQHRNATVAEIETDWARRTDLLSWMVDEGLRHIRDVAQIVAAYHADPERVMDRIGETVDEGDDREGPPATGGSSA